MTGRDPTPEELLARAEEADDFTFLFCWLDDDDRWRRDAKQYTDLGFVDPQVAYDDFWGTRSPDEVLLSCCLQGQVATVDEPMYADEPDIEDEYYENLLAEYDNSGRLLQHFTVFSVWDTGDGFKRHSRYVNAVDPLHAELITRAHAHTGTFLVCGVVELHVPVVDLTEFEVFATENGRAPEPRREPEKKRWFWQR